MGDLTLLERPQLEGYCQGIFACPMCSTTGVAGMLRLAG